MSTRAAQRLGLAFGHFSATDHEGTSFLQVHKERVVAHDTNPLARPAADAISPEPHKIAETERVMPLTHGLVAHGLAVQSDIAMTLISAFPRQPIFLREQSLQNIRLELRLIGN
jgi:hypothetical protein